ncbi:MAG: ABC transporter ATP-binding protein [Gammaproteobacteria bacterium]|nr:ABC transporter ATP-binding protein [Gammaproteobacteria bacterium]
MSTIIDYKDVCFSYGKQQILSNLYLKINQGENVAIIGHNGAGKTTLIKLLIGVLSPNSGVIDSIDYVHTAKLGFMPEQNALYAHLTGMQLMEYYASLKNTDKSSIMGILKLVNIDFAVNKKIADYSKGMKQRLMLAQALLSNPKILILDEPYSGLDPSSRELFNKIFKDLRSKGHTIIFSSHTLDGIQNVIDNVIFINKGKVALSGNIKTIMQDLNLDNEIKVTLSENTNIENIVNSITSLINNYNIKHGVLSIYYKDKHNINLLRTISQHPEIMDIEMKKANVNDIYHHIYNNT